MRSVLVTGLLLVLVAFAGAQEESTAAGQQQQQESAAPPASSDAVKAEAAEPQAQQPQVQQLQQESAAAAAEESVLGPKGSGVPDPLNLGAVDEGSAQPADMPPFAQLNQAAGFVAPGLQNKAETGLALDIDGRIKQTEDVVARMVWQINRETAWANSVRDIIQNYQYKYSKVLSSIKQHSASTTKMRELLSQLKKARLHEVLEQDLSKASRELTELAASSTDTNEDDGSYASLKDRVALMKQDLEKMSNVKVNKVLHGVQDQLKTAAQDAIPKPSSDTLKGLIDA